jgi:hypothetical protein
LGGAEWGVPVWRIEREKPEGEPGEREMQVGTAQAQTADSNNDEEEKEEEEIGTKKRRRREPERQERKMEAEGKREGGKRKRAGRAREARRSGPIGKTTQSPSVCSHLHARARNTQAHASKRLTSRHVTAAPFA